jgi:ABC-type dipeptide/oligopeptide/nickel transport system ATPase component
MGLMAQFVDHLAVMYAGRLVELGGIVMPPLNWCG